MADQVVDAGGVASPESSAMTERGASEEPADRVSCSGCLKDIWTFSGERRFCIQCTRFLIESEVSRREFATGCLRDADTEQASLEAWTVSR